MTGQVYSFLMSEYRTGPLLPRAAKGVVRLGLRINGRDVQTTTDGYPVAKVATVPCPALRHSL